MHYSESWEGTPPEAALDTVHVVVVAGRPSEVVGDLGEDALGKVPEVGQGKASVGKGLGIVALSEAGQGMAVADVQEGRLHLKCESA